MHLVYQPDDSPGDSELAILCHDELETLRVGTMRCARLISDIVSMEWY